MDTAGLLVARHGTDYVPPLLTVRSTGSVDRVTVKMLAGQTIDDYAQVADRLAQTFGAADCRVRSIPGRRHLLQLWLLICDPLEDIVPPFPPDPDCLTAGIPVALVEDGTVWRLPLLGNHILIVGATGAGKASVIWSIIAGLVDHIANGAGEGVGGRPQRRHGTRPRPAPVRPLRPRRLPRRRRLRKRPRPAPRRTPWW